MEKFVYNFIGEDMEVLECKVFNSELKAIEHLKKQYNSCLVRMDITINMENSGYIYGLENNGRYAYIIDNDTNEKCVWQVVKATEE